MKNLLVSFLLLCGASAGAQDILSYVPYDADFLFSWNAGQINKKINTRQLMQQESFDLIFQEMVKGLDSLQQDEYMQIIADPAAFGINSRQSIHFFGQTDAEGTYYGLLLPLANASLLESFVSRQADVMDQPVLVEDYGAYKMARLDGYHVGWNAQTAIIAGGRAAVPEYDFWGYPEDNYDYDFDLEEEDYEFDLEDAVEEEPLEIIEQEAPDIVAAWMDRLFQRSFGPSLRTHSGFVKAAAEPADAHLWMDYQRLASMGQSPTGLPVSLPLDGLYDGVNLSMRFHFNPGKMDVEMEMVGTGMMIDLMKKGYKPRFKKRMLRYVDKRFLLGYYAVRIDVKTMAEGMRDVVYESVAETPMYGESIIRAMDVLGILIDEDALYDLFRGDMLLAVTGVQRTEIPLVTYEYDENFNASQTEITIEKETPEFVLTASYGNEENLKKIIRLAESFDMALDMGGYYQVGGKYALGMEKGVLVFTNDHNLVTEHLKKGLKKDLRLEKSHRRDLRKNVQSIYWDAVATWEVMGKKEKEEASGSRMESVFNQVKGKVESISMRTSRKPSVKSVISIQLADKKANALEQGVDLLNLLILEAAGLSRI
jgi:hypothetical protein